MKTGRLFWGTFFVVLGSVALLTRFGVIHLHTFTFVKFWPFFLILWGISALVTQRAVKLTATVLTATGFGLILGSLLSFDLWQWDEDYDNGSHAQRFVEPYTPAITHASFSLDSGAGEFIVGQPSSDLIEAQAASTVGRYDLGKESDEHSAQLRLRMRGKFRGFRFGRHANHVEVRLNVNPVWDMDFDVGAARAELNLAPYKTQNVSIDAGVSDLRLRLGANTDETHVRISVGASSVRIDVPQEAGCEVLLDTGLSSKRLNDFEKIDSDTYRTENFSNAACKIYVTIDAGVSKIRVNRY